MFSSIGRFFRAIGYLFTGQIDKAYKSLLSKIVVVQATYDNVIQEKKNRVNEYTNAISAMVAEKAKKELRRDELKSEIEYQERLKAGALALAKQVAVQFNNDAAQLATNADYIRCQGAFRVFSSTIDEKVKSFTGVTKDLTTLETNLIGHKTQIQTLMRDLEKIKTEKGSAVADLISAQEAKKINQLISGISEDKSAKDLEAVRNVVNEAKAQASVASELSGLDVKRAESEFLEYATSSQADDEFNRLIGVTKQSVSTPVVDTTKIAE